MHSARRAIFAGFWGGLLAGLLDAITTLLTSSGMLDWANRFHLIAIEGGLGALAGAALAIVFVGWTLAFQREPARSRWLSAAHAVALLLSLPLVVYDAFALFHGTQASRIPEHRLLSVILIVVGAAAIWVAVTLWGRLLSRVEPEVGAGTSAARSRALPVVIGVALILAALIGGWANRNVLPRLYPWFHLSLTLLSLLACVLAIRMLLGLGRRILGKRWSWILAASAAAALLAGGICERPILSRSQGLRYFIYEKTQLASLFVRLLPTPKPRASKVSVTSADEALPPLPPGPHRLGADVVLITVDAVRADHLGCYGYARPTSPNIDALAARGVRFEHAYTQAPHTSFSLASVMIGKYYPTLARLASSDTHQTLAWMFRRYGWKTAAFFPPAVFYIDAHKMKAFESSNFDFEYVKYEYLDAEGRIRQIEDFLHAEHPDKLFLWLHLFEPHEPYERHPGFDFGVGDVDRYDSEIAYADSVVGKVVALIERKRPGAIIILAADHGEEFGEHGGRYHGTTLFEEQVHVPLIVVAPGLTPHAVAGPTQLIDIPATIFGLLDFPLPARMRGTDLGPWLATPPAPVGRLPPAFAEVEDKRMVVAGSEKLVCDVSKDFCSYFDLQADPREQHDLADQRPERLAALRQQLDKWLGEQARYESKLLGAADGTGELARAIERGRLGDASAALALAEMLVGSAPVVARREAASLLVTALPPKQETLAALRLAADEADDEEVRAWAAVTAVRLGASDVGERLHTLLAKPATEATEALRVHAALALAERSDAAGIPVLCAALDSCGNDVLLCKRILVVLGDLKDARATQPLVAHLAFVQTRRENVEALGAIADPASAPALIGALETDAYVPVRAAAAGALGRLGGARARQALQTALGHEHEAAVLSAVRGALAAHGRR
jgi:glucan phosphoethanolaminetransferase (alkaline phosphatase superfamily)/HEAT repeat protein